MNITYFEKKYITFFSGYIRLEYLPEKHFKYFAVFGEITEESFNEEMD